jgi:hypothetical protein
MHSIIYPCPNYKKSVEASLILEALPYGTLVSYVVERKIRKI